MLGSKKKKKAKSLVKNQPAAQPVADIYWCYKISCSASWWYILAMKLNNMRNTVYFNFPISIVYEK